MAEKHQVAHNWSDIKFGDGRFRVIHDLLDEYEILSKAPNKEIDREEFLKHCESDEEREAMLKEMDYLDELANDPITFVGQYLIEKPVAIGGFGVVSLAYCPDGTPVAVKVPHMSWQLARTKEELEFESIILHELVHPNIVKVIEFGHDDNWFMVTEWIHGLHLGQAMSEVEAPIDHWIHIVLQVCEALSFGHSLGIVHRDIKPQNIMVHGEGTPSVKVLDYGIAKRLGPNPATTEHVKGTREFTAPEQYQGECDVRSDIYSLGITLGKVLDCQPTCPKSKSLQKVVRIATQKNPQKRYQTVMEMRGDIETIRDGGVIRTSPFKLTATKLLLSMGLTAFLIAALFFNWSKDPKMENAMLANQQAGEFASGLGSEFAKDAQSVDGPSVFIKTVPSGGSIAAIPIIAGEPSIGQKIELGSVPYAVRLKPGEYLFVAKWANNKFTEVLRQVPNRDAPKAPPISPFNAFKRKSDGTIVLSPIRYYEAEHSDSVEVDGLWIDNMPTQIAKNFPHSTFAMLCRELEAQGKRMPFYSELVSSAESAKIAFDGPEWTASILSRNALTFPTKDGKAIMPIHLELRIFNQFPGSDPIEYCSEFEKSGELRFRGVRADKPMYSGN